MEITHEDIMKFIYGGQPSWKFNDNVIVYSEDEMKANIYNAMVYIKELLQPTDDTQSLCECQHHEISFKSGSKFCQSCKKLLRSSLLNQRKGDSER